MAEGYGKGKLLTSKESRKGERTEGSEDKTYSSKACSSNPLALIGLLSNNPLIYEFINTLIEEASTLMMHLLLNIATSWG